MKLPFVSLCPEITRAHALTLMDWLEDERVTRHLSDSPHVSRFIERIVDRVQLPVLTHLFNQGGRFFMICDRHDAPVGFVRLVATGPVYPEDADERAGKISVSSSIGTAILGYREGDALHWRVGERTSRIQIANVLYQPEAAGDFHL